MHFDGSGDNEKPEVDRKEVVKKIGTHDGTFHADEVMACVMLKQLDGFENAVIVRSRDEAVLRGCHVVVDVGGVYNHDTRRYDHHQRGFEISMSMLQPELSDSTIKLSSAGLIYAHYGQALIRKYLQLRTPETVDTVTEEVVNALWAKVYTSIVQEVDAIDNGISVGDNCRYKINTNLSARVGKLNPQWRGPTRDANTQFNLAMQLVQTELMGELDDAVNYWWPARDAVFQAAALTIARDSTTDTLGQVITLDSFCPWVSHLMEYEKVHSMVGHFKFVIFQDNESWRVRAVPQAEESFELRGGLHPEWRGLRDDELSRVAGIRGCVFVHMSGFIGGATTYAGANEMAIRSLQFYASGQQAP